MIFFYMLLVLVAVFCVVTIYLAMRTRGLARQAIAEVPPVGKFIDAGRVRFHYTDKGSGPPVVLIHGLGGTLHHFPPSFIDSLSADFRVIALDRSGSGYSTRPSDHKGRLPEQAIEIRDFLDALGVEKPLVVGHSLGGMIALTLALNHASHVSGLVLLSPLTRGFAETPAAFAPLRIPSRRLRWLIASTIAVPMAQRTAEPTMAFIFGPQKPPANYMVDGGGWLGLRPRQFFTVSSDYTATTTDIDHISSRYGELAMPVGLIVGDSDQVLDYRQQSLPMADDIEGADIEVLAGVGHMPQFVEPAKVTAMIRRIAGRAFDVH